VLRALCPSLLKSKTPVAQGSVLSCIACCNIATDFSNFTLEIAVLKRLNDIEKMGPTEKGHVLFALDAHIQKIKLTNIAFMINVYLCIKYLKMDTALTLDFPYVQEKEIRIINFTSNAVGVVKNIPWIFLSIIILPFYFIFFLPFANLILWRLYKNMQKEIGKLKRDIPDLPYKEAKEGYELISRMVEFMEGIAKEMAPDSNSFMFKGIYQKFQKISDILRDMQSSIADVLYLKADATPLSAKEKEAFKAKNDIWGDDSDQVYARHTHHHLTKRLKEHGV
jgi:hypothetical protein